VTTTKKGWQELVPDFPTDRRMTLACYRLAKLLDSLLSLR
jgi:hypothetical protein